MVPANDKLALVTLSKLVISGGNGMIVLESGKRVFLQMSEFVQMLVESLVTYHLDVVAFIRY